MIADEHKFILVDEERAPEPEDGLEEVDWAGTGDARLDRSEGTACAQPRQLQPAGLSDQFRPCYTAVVAAGKKDLPGIDPKHRPVFCTKLELAFELLQRARCELCLLGKPLWVVADGASAKAAVLKPAMALRLTVVSRLPCFRPKPGR